MSTYRTTLPQLGNRIFLTDGGLETTLVFHKGVELPHLAAFDLINRPEGEALFREYYESYLQLALNRRCGFVLESPTWRANPDWASAMGYNSEELDAANRRCVELLETLREEYQHPACPVVVSACIGPKGDGYAVDEKMSEQEAAFYHSEQIATIARTSADMVSAMTINYPEEAIGITRAAGEKGLPVSISFTVETDGRLPSGHSLQEAIEIVDEATEQGPAYYMINCAHPDHFKEVLDGDWVARIRGIRANASRLSHEELDEAEQLDDGDPDEFGQLYAELIQRFPHLTVIGGCCGTDQRHVEAAGHACCGVPQR